MAREALELGIYSMALGTESKPVSGRSKDLYLTRWRSPLLQSLTAGAKNIPGVREEEETCCPFWSFFFFFLFLQIRVFGFQVVSELYKKKSLSGTGEGMLA